MPQVVGIVFRSGGKVYYFDPGGLQIEQGDLAVVQTSRGMEIGEVADPPHMVPDEDIPAPLKTVFRRANEKDREAMVVNEGKKEEALKVCQELIDKHGLDMKLIDAEIMFGGGKITFSFFAERRVDFRALVADLAKRLKMRIELRQVGERDEARLLGGLGPCGRCLCCTLYKGDQEPVSIRMAKEQKLPLNPLKISGLCGRLMCCLKYEQEQYVDFRKAAPSRGSKIDTPYGSGEMVGYVVPKESLSVKLEDGTVMDVPASQCMCGGKCCMEDWGDVPEPQDLGAPEGQLQDLQLQDVQPQDVQLQDPQPREDEGGGQDQKDSPPAQETASREDQENASSEGQDDSKRSRQKRGGRRAQRSRRKRRGTKGKGGSGGHGS